MEPSVEFLNPMGQLKSGCELPVHLAFGGAGADCAPADQVADVLWRDGIEVFGTCAESQLDDVREELACRLRPVLMS